MVQTRIRHNPSEDPLEDMCDPLVKKTILPFLLQVEVLFVE